MTKLIVVSFVDLFTGDIPAESVSGPVGIVKEIGNAAQSGLMSLMSLMAMLSVNLGIMNLLPLPALDGGRIFFVVIEMIFRKPVPQDKEAWVHFVGFALLMLLMIQFFSGYFAFGQVIAGFTAVYRGMVSGISAAFVYLMLGVSGFFAVLITALPFAAASAAVLILGARESARLSRRIADYSFFGNQDGNNPPDGRLYMLKFAVLILLAFALSLADVLIAYFLGRIFFAV